MSDNRAMTAKQAGGAFADGLTLIRILVTPLIMAIIILAWPETKMAVLASVLFVIAALTDIFDDYFGGASESDLRKYGWLDNIADTILIIGTLIALLFVVYRAGILAWPFAIPAIIIIGREVIVGLFKGFDLVKHGWPDSLLSNAKVGLSMLAVCIFVASPWITQALDMMRADPENPMAVFNATSPWVWAVGQFILWIAATLSIITAVQIFKFKLTANDK